jgi:hypothetical protein
MEGMNQFISIRCITHVHMEMSQQNPLYNYQHKLKKMFFFNKSRTGR